MSKPVKTKPAQKSLVGVEITTDTSISVDWGALSLNLGTVLAQGFATALNITDGTSNAISALISAAGAIRLDSKPGEKAFQVISLCFAWTLDQVFVASDAQDPKNLSESIIKAVRKNIADNNIMPASFLHRPTTLPLYISLRDEFAKLKATESRSEIIARFDASFNRSVYELWSRRAEFLLPLLNALNAPGREANEFEREWEAYRSNLVTEFEVRPIFGQEQSKVPLSALYIPLRAAWSLDAEEKVDIDNHERSIIVHEVHLKNIGMLEDLLINWIKADTPDDPIRLVGGGPGSGKSTSMKAISRKLAELRSIRPLYIPLQHISLDGELRDSINSYFASRTGSPFTRPPLSRQAVEDGPPLLLIFDGLDELSRPGDAANEVAQLFVSRLSQMLAALNGDSKIPTKVIATGRMPSFQAVGRQIGCTGHKSLEVIGYLPQNPEELHKNCIDLGIIDQRPLWWGKYSKESGLGNNTPLPQALTDARLEGITHEPLLCYLLALSGFAIENWEAAADNRNRIYGRLIDAVWERGWGEGAPNLKRQGPGKTLSRRNFNHLMETIGLAAWLGGDTRVATEVGFLEAIEITSAQSPWSDFKKDSGADVANLAMNFYLKSSEIEQRGFEFTHKSFGEYLAARALVRVAESLHQYAEKRIDIAMQDWLRATKSGTLTDEILVFLRDEMRLKFKEADPKIVESILATFEKIINNALLEGFPAHGNTTLPWRSAETHQRNSEIMAWSILNSCLMSLNISGKNPQLANINWPNEELSFQLLLERVRVEKFESSFLRCLSFISIRRASVFGLPLMDVDFRGADLSHANLSGCHLMRGNFNIANLTGTQLERAHLDGANFANANVEGADLRDARIGGADFTGARGTPSVNARTFLDLDSRANLTLFRKWRATKSPANRANDADFLAKATKRAVSIGNKSEPARGKKAP